MDSLAGFVRAGLEDGRDGVSITDSTQVVLTGGLKTRREDQLPDRVLLLTHQNT